MRILEAHTGISAKIAQKAGFDGIWISSLTESASKGLPDNELTAGEERLRTIREIRRVCDLPIIVDWDTGGKAEHLLHWIPELEKAGVDIVVLEDKTGLKKNSLLKEAEHILEDIDVFSDKLMAAKGAVDNMLVFARVESLIAKKSMYNALIRAEAYLQSGADGIVIHSKQQISAEEVMTFAYKFKKQFNKPLMAIPTTYNLPKKHQFDIVVYANHMLRASVKAMQVAADKLIKDDKNIDMISVKELLCI